VRQLELEKIILVAKFSLDREAHSRGQEVARPCRGYYRIRLQLIALGRPCPAPLVPHDATGVWKDDDQRSYSKPRIPADYRIAAWFL